MGINYDVIIAGAGPAGAQCARYLAWHSKYSVLLLDKTQEIGEPKKSTGGIHHDIIKLFKLPEKVVQYRVKQFVFESKNEETVFPVDACVLDFGLFKKFLAEDAVHHGAVLQIQSSVTAPVVENKKVVGVQYEDSDGVHEVRAKIVIDATGPSAVLASKLGLRKPDQSKHWVGVEFEMENLKLKRQKSVLINFNQDYSPGGYSWIFSTGINHAKVGVCWNVELFKKKGAGSQVSYLKKWIKEDARLKTGEAMEMHAGDAYSEYLRPVFCDGFMCAGDSVCTIEPLFGEGIRWSLYSGTFAAQTAIEALKAGDFSAKKLGSYEQKWDSLRVSRRLGYLLSRAMYRMSDNGFDKFVVNLGKFDKAGIKRLIDYKFTIRDVLKLIPIPGLK